MQLVWVMTLATALPAMARAQVEVKEKPAAAKKRTQTVVEVADTCPYRAATPYNAIIVHRPVPNPANNMPNLVLSCDIHNQNTDTYVPPPCEWGNWLNRCGGGCGGGCGACDNGCGSLFGRIDFGRGCGTGNCNSGCNSCGSGYRGWQRFSCGSNCGSNAGCGGCNQAAPAPAPANAPMPASNLKPVAEFEQVGCFLRFNRPNTPTTDCLQCPGNGPPHKYGLPTPGSMGCTGCSTVESESVFIFGTCRQFWGEPTHRWLNGK
jgi:hypothetical protein